MDQSLYMTIETYSKIDEIVDDIKNNLNDRLITEMRYIIREYNKSRRKIKSVGKIDKIDRKNNSPSLLVNFN